MYVVTKTLFFLEFSYLIKPYLLTVCCAAKRVGFTTPLVDQITVTITAAPISKIG